MKFKNEDEELTIDEEFEEIRTVLDAYANEVGMMRAFNKNLQKNLANLMERVKVLEEERAAYEETVSISDEFGE